MEIDYVALGKRIMQRRKQEKLRQNMLAEILDISNNYLSGIECGKEHPTLELLAKICKALNVTPNYLLLGNMYSNNVPSNFIDGLRLCTDDDIALLAKMVEYIIERQDHTTSNKFI